MNLLQILFIIGRILLGGFFIYSGIGHFMKLEMLSGYAKSKKVPVAKFAVVLTGIMLLVGGLAILLNMYIYLGMLILVVFLIGTTVMMHPFWKEKDAGMRMTDQLMFMKNLAILGALLMMLSW